MFEQRDAIYHHQHCSIYWAGLLFLSIEWMNLIQEEAKYNRHTLNKKSNMFIIIWLFPLCLCRVIMTTQRCVPYMWWRGPEQVSKKRMAGPFGLHHLWNPAFLCLWLTTWNIAKWLWLTFLSDQDFPCPTIWWHNLWSVGFCHFIFVVVSWFLSENRTVLSQNPFPVNLLCLVN